MTAPFTLAAALLAAGPADAVGPGRAPLTAPRPAPRAEVAPEAEPAPPREPLTAVRPVPPPTPERLDVYPPDVSLTDARDRQAVIAVLTLSDGTTRDVTHLAEFRAADATLVEVKEDDGGAVGLGGASDGVTTLTVEHLEFSVDVPVTVAHSDVVPPVTFRNDVMPVFARTGCNMGSCHGAARGKDGFRLSLFGFDPAGDHFRLTREQPGRRLNMAVPKASLLYEKSVGAVSHTGGKRFEDGDRYARVLVDWIAAGAEDDASVPACVELQFFPPAVNLAGAGSTQRTVARAVYADGTDRDVTDLVAFASANPTAAAVGTDGVVTAGETSGAGGAEAFLTARFDVHTVGVPAVVLPARAAPVPAGPAPRNYIDELVDAKLAALRIAPSEVCTDAEFVRRVHLDLAGALPTAEVARAFVASDEPGKRAALVDDLLAAPEFADVWVMKWSELLKIRTTNNFAGKNAVLYHAWLREQIDENRPVDEMVFDLLAGTGGTFSTPAVNFYQTETDTLKTAENVAQVFLGMRVQCAQCHNHPFDRWTMDDYYGFAALFAQVKRKNGDDPREKIIFDGGGAVKHPVTGATVEPKFLGGEAPDFGGDDRGKTRREAVAEWLTSSDNPYFARNVANVVWAHHTGRGVVEPVDDVRVSNPPANAALLDALADRLVESGFDVKALVRDVCTSRTYQLATRANPTNAGDSANFARAPMRRIRAEVLLDGINAVTNAPDKFRGLPLGSRAVEIADGNVSNYFLDTFGRAKRETVCSCEVRTDPNLSQALHLVNGAGHAKVRQGKVVETLLNDGAEPADVLAEITARCLSREPTAAEVAALGEVLSEDGADPRAVLEDYFWAVLNSREFLFNH